MAKPNEFPGFCDVCRARVGVDQGRMIPDPEARVGYRILCVEHAPEGSFKPPAPPEVSKLPSIHHGEAKYER